MNPEPFAYGIQAPIGSVTPLFHNLKDAEAFIAKLTDSRDAAKIIPLYRASPTTPAECAVLPEWTSKPYWVDPPSGHRYGFPKLYDPATDGDMTEWMIRNGYPKRLASLGLPCTFTAATESGEK